MQKRERKFIQSINLSFNRSIRWVFETSLERIGSKVSVDCFTSQICMRTLCIFCNVMRDDIANKMHGITDNWQIHTERQSGVNEVNKNNYQYLHLVCNSNYCNIYNRCKRNDQFKCRLKIYQKAFLLINGTIYVFQFPKISKISFWRFSCWWILISWCS